MSASEPSNRITLTLAEVLETYHAARRVDQALAAYGATAAQVALLVAIVDAPGVGMRALARTLGVGPPALTIGIDRLEHQGLAQRVTRRSPEGPVDRRRVAVELTERGRALLERLATIEIER